jgi:hypothetical protein
MSNKLQSRKGDDGKRIKATQENQTPYQFDYPIFCFRHIHRIYGLEQCTANEKSALIDRLYKLSQLTWQQISITQRHGFGFEKIEQTSIKTEMPKHITKDVTLYSFRFDGLKPFVGYRSTYIFHIVFIDRDFTLYNH